MTSPTPRMTDAQAFEMLKESCAYYKLAPGRNTTPLWQAFNTNLRAITTDFDRAFMYMSNIMSLALNMDTTNWDRALMAADMEGTAENLFDQGLQQFIAANDIDASDERIKRIRFVYVMTQLAKAPSYNVQKLLRNLATDLLEYNDQLRDKLARMQEEQAAEKLVQRQADPWYLRTRADTCLNFMDNSKDTNYSMQQWFTIMCAYKACHGDVNSFIQWTLQAYPDDHDGKHAKTIRTRWESIRDNSRCGLGTLLYHTKRFRPDIAEFMIEHKADAGAAESPIKPGDDLDALVNSVCAYDLSALDPDIHVEQYDEQWMRPYQIDKYNILAHISPLGSGKTQSLKAVLQSKKAKRVLYLSNRILFAYNIADEFHEFGFKSYTEFKGPISHDRVICSIESITRLSNTTFDVVIMDESEALLSIFSSSTCGSRYTPLASIVKQFQYVMTKAKHVIACDAFMTDRTLNFLQTLRHMRNKTRQAMIVSVNSRLPVRKQAFNMKQKQLMNKIYKSAMAGSKFCVVAGTKKFAFDVEDVLRGIPDVKYLLYTGDTQDTGERGKNTIRSVRDSWSAVDVVIYTSCITTGVNYDVPGHFDKLFVYGSAATCVVRDTFQSMMRVRNTTTQQLYYTTDGRRHSEDFKRKHKIAGLDDKDIKSWLKRVHQFNEDERNISRNLYDRMFSCYLQRMNYEVIEVKEGSVASEKAETVATTATEGELTYEDIPLVDLRELEIIKNRISTNSTIHLDREKVKKYYMLQRISPECPVDTKKDLTPEQAAWKYIASSRGEKVHQLAYAHVQGAERVETMIEDEKEAKSWTPFMHKHVKVMPDVRAVIEALGFDMLGQVRTREHELYEHMDVVMPLIKKIETTLGDVKTVKSKDKVLILASKLNNILKQHMGLLFQSVKNSSNNVMKYDIPADCPHTDKKKGKFYHIVPEDGTRAIYHHLTPTP